MKPSTRSALLDIGEQTEQTLILDPRKYCYHCPAAMMNIVARREIAGVKQVQSQGKYKQYSKPFWHLIILNKYYKPIIQQPSQKKDLNSNPFNSFNPQYNQRHHQGFGFPWHLPSPSNCASPRSIDRRCARHHCREPWALFSVSVEGLFLLGLNGKVRSFHVFSGVFVSLFRMFFWLQGLVSIHASYVGSFKMESDSKATKLKWLLAVSSYPGEHQGLNPPDTMRLYIHFGSMYTKKQKHSKIVPFQKRHELKGLSFLNPGTTCHSQATRRSVGCTKCWRTSVGGSPSLPRSIARKASAGAARPVACFQQLSFHCKKSWY